MFEMEERNIDGVRLRTWKAAPPTLRSVLDLSPGHGDADYVVYGDERTTFAAHYRRVATLARRLHEDLGVRKGYGLAWEVPMPAPRELDALGDAFRPYRSVAAWYCWRAVELYARAAKSALTG